MKEVPTYLQKTYGGLKLVKPRKASSRGGKKRRTKLYKKTKRGRKSRKLRKGGGKTSMRTTGLIPPGAGSATMTPTPQYKLFF